MTVPHTASPCPPWCTADHTSDDHFRIHQKQEHCDQGVPGRTGQPTVHVSLSRVDEPERRGKTLITIRLLASGDTLHLPPNDAHTLADILDALQPDCPSPTDVLSGKLSEAADLAALEQAKRDQPNLTHGGGGRGTRLTLRWSSWRRSATGPIEGGLEVV
ncbi:hypothetical protein ETD86_29570 [Nonomuraea turkmeniaca]|uniref:Uncharacterized protein n=1 Tax=Nonomuraea turkmeniaca TaxID=103838 RepID=A0A5S4FA68_9ACTN|nr:hypothetical protein [Nonomuraea turkmeniaca]TMR14097.1 hypothetical protein ETD86_29570 [Nonomuraea turkmeniaca]